MLRRIYVQTVKPVTYTAVLLSSYTRGYSDVCDRVFDKKIEGFVGFVQSNTESILWGIGIGVTYPVSIPVLAMYIYNEPV